jgi:hypothetical protein
MARDHGKKITPAQKLAQQRRHLLEAAETVMEKPVQAQNAAHVYLSLRAAEGDLRTMREAVLTQARKEADEKRFWTAFGLNTPLAVGLLFIEPVTGTIAAIGTVLMGYTPTVLVKRMLDDHKVGEAAAIKAVLMDVETMDAVIARLQKQCSRIEKVHAADVLAGAGDAGLFKRYPELKETFAAAAQTAAQPVPEQNKAPPPRVRRFGM